MIDYIVNEPKMFGDNQVSHIIGTCLSTDEKPVIGIYYNSMLFETNTQEWYVFDNTKTWKKSSGSSGGTTVIANPTLSGTEEDLVSLQIDETKYVIPSNGGSGILFVGKLTIRGATSSFRLNRTWKEIYDAKFSVLILDTIGEFSCSLYYPSNIEHVSDGITENDNGYWVTYFNYTDHGSSLVFKSSSEDGYPVLQENEPEILA